MKKKMYLYAGAVTAQIYRDGLYLKSTTQTMIFTLAVEDIDKARGHALSLAKKYLPESEGYFNHGAVCDQVPQDMINSCV